MSLDTFFSDFVPQLFYGLFILKRWNRPLTYFVWRIIREVRDFVVCEWQSKDGQDYSEYSDQTTSFGRTAFLASPPPDFQST